MIPQRMVELLKDYAKYIKSDEACTDDFLAEGTSFVEVEQLMDHVAKAVEEYVQNHSYSL